MTCPNCSAEAPTGAAECPKCSVVFAKWQARVPAAAPPPPASSFPWLPLVAALGLAAAGAAYFTRRPPPPTAVQAPAAPAAAEAPAPSAVPADATQPPAPISRFANVPQVDVRQQMLDKVNEGMKAKQEAFEAKMKDPETIKRGQEELKKIEDEAQTRVMTSQGYRKNADGVWEKSPNPLYLPR